jgi:hypothetical protein
MRLVISFAAAGALALAPPAFGQEAADADCSYDRDAMMALDQRAFDQDFPDGGWRAVGSRPGCEIAAADLIARWREANPDRMEIPGLLLWHEGEMRAIAGDYPAAIAVMLQTRRELSADRELFDRAWNAYVDATVAFLNRDRAALEAAQAQLAEVPEPSDWAAMNAGSPQPMAWPMNSLVVAGLLACFDKPYAQANTPACSAPS